MLKTLFIAALVAYSTRAQLVRLQEICQNATEACVVIPEGCLADESCQVISLISFVGNATYRFDVAAKALNYSYVALGFSDDEKMNDDAVVDCYLWKKDEIKVSAAFNGPPTNDSKHPHAVLDTEVDNLKKIGSGRDDDSIYCTFDIKSELTVDKYTATMDDNDAYYLLLAAGPVDDKTNLPKRHTDRAVSKDKFVFNSAHHTAAFTLLVLIPAFIGKFL